MLSKLDKNTTKYIESWFGRACEIYSTNARACIEELCVRVCYDFF